MITTLFWDLDGTLFDFFESERVCVTKCLAAVGAPHSAEDVALYSRINDAHWKRYERGEIDRQEVNLGRFREFFKTVGFSGASPQEVHQAYQEELAHTWFFQQDALETLEELRRRGFRQYAVTNGNVRVQHTKLVESGLKAYFDAAFISEELGAAKPDPAFFDAVFAALPGVFREECLMIGDSLSADILGANRAHLRCVWFNPRREENRLGARPDYEVDHLREILRLPELQPK